METIDTRPPRKRYSETIRNLAPILAQHVEGSEILRALVAFERGNGTESESDIAEAMYWIGANYHAGQSCPLYAAIGATRFRPSILARGVTEGSAAEMLYEEIVMILA